MGNARGRGRFFVRSGGMTHAGGLAARRPDLRGGLTRAGGLVARTVWLAVLGRFERLASACRPACMQKAGAPCGTPALFYLLPALLTRAWRAA